VLAGSQGFEAAETLEAIARSPARDRILVTGYISDAELAAWYAKASIFAFPSLDEGFGIPLIEAMAAGIPVLTANKSALPEVTGDAALLIDPGNEMEMESALQSLAANETLRSSLIAKGLIRSRDFPWSKAVSQTESVYRELLK
jgi:glycosyltransferase involved in cell wall biosynthesis